MKITLAGLIVLLGCTTIGCASLVAPGPDMILISSDPEGAQIKLDGQPVGTTPIVVHFHRRAQGALTLELAGYETASMKVGKVFNGWFAGNVIFGGVIGILIDIIAQNDQKFPTAPIRVTLTPSKPNTARQPPVTKEPR